MANVLHGNARTTPRIRAELQRSQEKTSVLAQRYGLSRTTVTKWRSRITTADAPMGPTKSKSTVLSPVEETVIVELRRRTLLPLDDMMGCLRESISKLSRSSLHRCLLRHGISRLPASDIKPPAEVSLRQRPLATCISTLPSCAWPKASSTCSWPLTGSPNLPMSSSEMTLAR
jgi:transposase